MKSIIIICIVVSLVVGVVGADFSPNAVGQAMIGNDNVFKNTFSKLADAGKMGQQLMTLVSNTFVGIANVCKKFFSSITNAFKDTDGDGIINLFDSTPVNDDDDIFEGGEGFGGGGGGSW